MSKDAHTGLYSDEAYEALTFVSALDSFVRNSGESLDEDEGVDDPCFDISSYFVGGGDLAKWGFKVDWVDWLQSWGSTADVTRSEVDGEIIIKDYFNAENRLFTKTQMIYIAMGWPDKSNQEKLQSLAQFIRAAELYLRQVFGEVEEVDFSTIGMAWLEPENSHGILCPAIASMEDYPSRNRHYHLKLSTLKDLFSWFNDGGRGLWHQPAAELKGVPWDSFKAASYCAMRKEQHTALVQTVDLTGGHIAEDELFRLEQEQRRLEEEWRKKAL